MAPLNLLLSFIIALSPVPGTLAGPACAYKYRNTVDCVQKCKSKWGWTGAVLGADRWGFVVLPDSSKFDLDAYIAKACGSRSDSSVGHIPAASTSSIQGTNLVTSSTAEPTVAVLTQSLTTAIATSSVVVASSSASSSLLFSVRSSSRATTSATPAAAPTRFTTIINGPTPRPTITATRAAQPTTPSTLDPGSGGTPNSSVVQVSLSSHNSVRAQHGAVSLTWSDDLAAKAQQWANRCQFEHSGGSLGRLGENLALGTSRTYNVGDAVASWSAEVSSYKPNNPVASHFTQVVWKATTQVGCALQWCDGIFPGTGASAQFIVCEYSQAGNVLGQFATNVQV